MKTPLELFEGMKEICGDDLTLIGDIERLGDQKAKARLLDGAREYYAKQYNCLPDEVFLGDLKFRPFYWKNGIVLPHVVIVGNLRAQNCTISASGLRVVYGELDLTGAKVESLSSLEYANRLVVTGATIENMNPNAEIDELVCNDKVGCKGFENCPKTKCIKTKQ